MATLLVAGLTLGIAWAPASAAPAAPASAGGKVPDVLSARLRALAEPATRRAPAGAQDTLVGLPGSGAGSLLRRDGSLLVNVSVVDPAAIAAAAALPGGELVATAPGGLTATVALPATALPALAGIDGLRTATEVLTPQVGQVGSPAAPAAPRAGGAAAVTCPTGVRSQGDAQLFADDARSLFGVDGTGVKVGVISDSIRASTSAFNADIASGDLPGPGNPCGHTTPITVLSDAATSDVVDEGRAMAQIVHDLAPGAEILFASAWNGEIDFANQVRALRDAGADVIVDDIGYFSETLYQDGPIAAAVGQVVADGVAYFSSAGNAELELGGRSVGSYETQGFRSTACPPVITAGAASYTCHDFDPGAGTTAYDTITVSGSGTIVLGLGWNEPIEDVTVDYDVLLVDPATNAVVAGSAADNPLDGVPVEVAGYENPTSSPKQLRLYVARFGGAAGPRFKFHFPVNDIDAVQFHTNAGGDVFGPTVYGHSGARATMAVAATPYNDDSSIEPFSSRGPSTTCWGPYRGSTPAAALPSCVTKQVDVAATDGVSTTLPPTSGLNPFYGTSAAAPHAAAVAALMLEHEPCRTNTEISAALRSTATPIAGETAAAQGAGLVDAAEAVGELEECDPFTPPADSVYVPVTPCRVADTRSGAGSPLGPNVQRGYQVGGTGPRFATQGGATGGCGVPEGATAVEASVTAVSPTGVGFFRAWPTGVAAPNATFLNYSGGRSITNTGSIALAATGTSDPDLTVRNFGSRAHYVIDVQGYYVDPVAAPPAAGSVYVPLTPCRVVDTRVGAGTPMAPNVQRSYQVGGGGVGFTAQGGASGGCGIPPSATAVEASVSAVAPAGGGFFRAWPSDVAAPNATFLNYSSRQSITNTGSIALAVTGTKDLTVRNFGSTADYVIDVQGYFVDPDVVPTGSLYVPLRPCRVVDTRSGGGSPLGPNAQRDYQVGGTGSGFAPQGGAAGGCGVPDGATAVEASVSAVGPTGGGFFRAWPTGVTPPNATFLNYASRQSITNTGSIALAATGTKDLTVRNYTSSAHYVIDIQGYYRAPGPS